MFCTMKHSSRQWVAFFLFTAIFPTFVSMASPVGIPIGQWRMHLPKNRIIALAKAPEAIIAVSEYGIVSYNLSDNSLDKFDKVDGLSGIGISSVGYDPVRRLILIGYTDGNLDVIRGGQVVNISDIFTARIMGSKRINHILVEGNRAFLSCDFGIVEVDLTNLLIRNTWFVGPFGSQVRVHRLEVEGGFFFAATQAGLLRAPTTGVNLADFQNWQRISLSGQPNESVNMVESFQGRLFANRTLSSGDVMYVFHEGVWSVFSPPGYELGRQLRMIRAQDDRLLISGESRVLVLDRNLQVLESIDNYGDVQLRAHDVILDFGNRLWFADDYYGLVRRNQPGSFSKFILQGPATANAFDMDASAGSLVVAPGSITPGGQNMWNLDGVFLFEDERWRWLNRFDFPLMGTATDIIRVAAVPGRRGSFYAATWTNGLLEFSEGVPVALWDETNSPLMRRSDIGDFIRLGGIAIDNSGNVWVTNSHSSHPIAVKRANNQWMNFSSRGVIGPSQMVGKIAVDCHNKKWVILPNGGGIYVFRERSFQNATDFDARLLTTTEGNGNLPSANVHSLAVDHNCFVWIGTDNGVSVLYNPQAVLRGEAVNAMPIIVRQDGFAGILFQEETVNSIAVDGSNKKWFGTSRSGAFLMSEDGRQTLMHFTTRNSPLPSNNVLDIAINGQTGEVFFATDRGIASFRALATEAAEVHSQVYAFPNPVPAGYAGFIAVSGLVRNARVKITDISGNLVFESIAEGGQAIWNGRDMFGNRPASGVYLVFSTNEDGSETFVTKILFLN